MELRAPRPLRLAAAALAAALAVLLLTAATAAADDDLRIQGDDGHVPAGYELTAGKVKRISAKSPVVEREKKLHDDLRPTAYTRKQGDWQVSWFSDGKETVQVIVSDDSGRITEQWSGSQVAWKMARGYPGAFGRKINALYVWIPLCILFVLPFVDPRRPFRMLHLDLLVLIGFSVSLAFFNKGMIDWSVPLAYPPLLYLLGRALWLGFRPSERRERLIPIVPVTWLMIGLLFLIGFRIALNAADSNVVDIGYAGVIGADRIMDGDELYGKGFHEDVGNGDTYGPVNYLAYIPFEQAISWTGDWDGLPAAHGAAGAFDLAVILGLLLLGFRLRPGPEGRELGIALAFAWTAYPFSAFSLESNANDSLVAATVVWALVFIASPVGRGAFAALAGATKFAPLALAPLFARGATVEGRRPPGRWSSGGRGVLVYALTFAAVSAAVYLPFLPDGGFAEIFERTVAYQAGRESPFSIWGQVQGLGWLHTALQVAAVALALLVAVFPRRRTPAQVAALAAAVLIALQLTVEHWFYLYIPWFAPLLFFALFAAYRGERRLRGGPPSAPIPGVAAQ